MKVLLMMPPMLIRDNYCNMEKTAANMPSLGLAFIYVSFKKAGCEVDFKDYQSSVERLEDIVKYIEANGFDMIGMQTYVSNINVCLEVSAAIKKSLPDVKILLGGAHATIFPDSVISCPDVDYVCVGEGEETVQDLVQALNNNHPLSEVKGIYYKDEDGTILWTGKRDYVANLDDLPIPKYDLFDPKLYFPAVHIRGRKVYNIISSRGCPYKCTFCAATEVWGNKYRYQSVNRTISEMKYLKEKMGADALQIYDDNFCTNHKRTKELCRSMIEAKLDLQWVCYTRADSIGDQEMLSLMKQAGCYMIVMGIENGNKRILELINKKLDLDVAHKNIRLARKVGINTLSSFMIGLPTETEQEIDNTISCAKSLGLSYAMFPIFTPYPGTPIYPLAEQEGVFLSKGLDKYSRWGDGVWYSKGMSTELYKKLQRKAFRAFYFRPTTVLFLLNEFLKLPRERVSRFLVGGMSFLFGR